MGGEHDVGCEVGCEVGHELGYMLLYTISYIYFYLGISIWGGGTGDHHVYCIMYRLPVGNEAPGAGGAGPL